MQRDKELRERRDMAIFNRFNQLIKTCETYQQIYDQLEEEFYLSAVTIKQIVLRLTHAR